MARRRRYEAMKRQLASRPFNPQQSCRGALVLETPRLQVSLIETGASSERRNSVSW